MWPFKKTPKVTLAEYAATRPAAPCGNQIEHVRWTEFEGWPCPVCAAIEASKRKEAEEDRMAEKIAHAVARKLMSN